MIDTTDPSTYTPEQARQAAQQILDETDGDLVGEQAEEFRALVDRAQTGQSIRAQQADIVARYRQGAHTERGDGSDRIDYVAAPIPAGTQERDTAMRVLDCSVRDGTLAAGGAETAEQLLQAGPPASRSWSARWTTSAGDPAYLRAFGKLIANVLGRLSS